MFEFNQVMVIFSRLDEVLLSLLSLSLIFIYFMFPFNKYLLNSFLKSVNFNTIDALCINIVIHSFIFLIISFFSINKFYFGILIITLSIITNLIFIKKNISKKDSLILLIFFVFLMTYCFKLASFASLTWDGLSHWFYKTQIFFQNGSISDFKKVPFPFYPHLGPYVWSFFWKLTNSEYEYLGRFFYIILFLSSCLCLSNRIKNYQLRIIFFVGIVFFLTETTLFGGYQEYFIFSLITIFSSFYFFFNEEFKTNKIKFSLLFLCILSLLPWIKDEGLMCSIILFFLIIVTNKYIIKEKLLFSILYLMGMILNYYIELNVKDLVDFQFELKLNSLMFFIDNLNYIFSTFLYFLFEFIKSSIRFPIWIFIIIFTILIFKNGNNSEKKFVKTLTLIFFLYIFILITGYMMLFVDQEFNKEAMWHLKTSNYRLILQVTGLFSVIVVKFLNINEQKFLK